MKRLIPVLVPVLITCSLITISLTYQLSENGMNDLVIKSQEVWKQYCDSKNVNETLAMMINTCLYISYDFETKRMTDCLKKFLPTDMDGSSMQKLRDTQCYQIPSSKVKEVYMNQYLKCMGGNKQDGFIGMCKNNKSRDTKLKCALTIINKFAKCLHKQGMITLS